jgi:hypothetical protein
MRYSTDVRGPPSKKLTIRFAADARSCGIGDPRSAPTRNSL